jgi:hypothetical protein
VPAVYAIVARNTKSPEAVAKVLEKLRAAVPGRVTDGVRDAGGS